MLSAYLPQDRRYALATGRALPRQASGAALFADISGFTPLAEALARTLGSRRGAEELASQLNRVYGALIAEVERYGGSVIDFSGDAITCWFDDAPQHAVLATSATLRAAACALAMHGALAGQGMASLPSGGVVLLAMKIGIAAGTVWRFTAGDPQHQLLDVLAGTTLERMAAAEQVAHRAEIVLSPECYAALGEQALIVEWRSALFGSSEERYPVLGGLLSPLPSLPWPALAPQALTDAQLQPWLLPAIRERYLAGGGEPAPELRPVTALFMGLAGLDYEQDPAAQLDGFVRWAQAVMARHGGALIQLTIGDKGCYLFMTFGAFAAHEDDGRRALASALELRDPPAAFGIAAPRIGISQGIMCSGAYGSPSRRAYGALGDETNLAARLMQAARPGTVLVSGRIQQALAHAFSWQQLPSILVKGKRGPVPAASLVAAYALPVPATRYASALVGRAAELTWLREQMEPVLRADSGCVLVIQGEAGSGKSRLAFELRSALSTEPALRWLVCAAAELSEQPLRVFRHLLRGYFGQQAGLAPADNRQHFDAILATLHAQLEQRAAHALSAALDEAGPFLAALLDFEPGPVYAAVDASQRRAATLAALTTLISAESLCQPLVVQVEDAHDLDEASRSLLDLLAAAVAEYPFALLLTSRARDDGGSIPLVPAAGPALHTLNLRPLNIGELDALAQSVLGGSCDPALANLLLAKTAGNALFAEQLTLDLRERQLLTLAADGRWQLGDLMSLEVPASLLAVLIARLDRLPLALRSLAQTAAVLGQEFDQQVLVAMLDEAGDLGAQLALGQRMSLWSLSDELRWRFGHALLRDAAYEMQLRVRLRDLHVRAALAIERVHAQALAGQVVDLAYHWQQAGNAERESFYLAWLAEQSYDASYFAEARSSFERALSLIDPEAPASVDAARLRYRLGRTFMQLGDLAAARTQLLLSLSAAEAHDAGLLAADAAFDLGSLDARQGNHDQALGVLERSLTLYRQVGERAGEGRALNQLASVYLALGDEPQALSCYEQALALPRSPGGRRR